jgi:hypothetical protein
LRSRHATGTAAGAHTSHPDDPGHHYATVHGEPGRRMASCAPHGSGELSDDEEAPLLMPGGGAGEARGDLSEASGPSCDDEAKQAPWYLQRRVTLTLGGYAFFALLSNFLDELTPLFASAPAAAGGLGLTTRCASHTSGG